MKQSDDFWQGFAGLMLAAVVWAAAVAMLGSLGCAVAQRDKASVYTEEGLRAAEQQWDAEYYRRLAQCMALHEPASDGAKACFGPTYDADAKVGAAVRSAVALLRVYWAARAAGESPDWAETAAQVAKLLADLPPDVKRYFERVRGVR